MANKNIFSTELNSVPKANTVNKAGGLAYDLNEEEKLCQYVATGTFNGTFYASAKESFEDIKHTVDKCSSLIVAKAAIYGREQAKMKDVPAYLVATLAARKELGLLSDVFPIVIDNTKMLLNFVQIVRSGVTGRKSFGTAVKRLIREWLDSKTDKQLFVGSIGHSKPSLADVIKMVHPRPTGINREALYGYLLGKDMYFDNLPEIVQDFESFKRDHNNNLPNVPFMALSNCDLTDDHWKEIALNMPWNTLRMNLNQLNRHNVFADRVVTKRIADKLSDPDLVRKYNVFPYQLLTTYQNIGNDLPRSITGALHDALEVATENIPDFGVDVSVCIDVSGSMSSSATGYRRGSTSVTTCRDVAALVAACVLRKNPDATILGWDTRVYDLTSKLDPRDSVLTNAQKIGLPGGGTDASVAMNYLNEIKAKSELILYVSDNESWYGRKPFWAKTSGTDMAEEWQLYTRRVKNAKLVCVDIQPYDNVQVPNAQNVLNVGGFSDSVFNVVDSFLHQRKSWVDTVQSVDLIPF